MEAMIAVSVFLFVTFLFAAVLTRPGSQIQRRLGSFREIAMAMAVEQQPQDESEPTFIERVIRPVARATVRAGRVVLPSNMADRVRGRLERAGDPVNLSGLIIIYVGCLTALPGLAIFVTVAGGEPMGPRQAGMIGATIAMGAYLPHLWLNLKTRKRQATILKTLPDAIDLLSTSVEAGLGVDAAISQVSQKVKGPIAEEFRRVLREMAMGSVRREALKAFADRSGVPDAVTFVNAIIQAEQMGVSLGQVIRVQADQMRMRRRQRAEQKAHQAPVKMTIPLVLFIFPTILVIILGPAVIQTIKAFSGT